MLFRKFFENLHTVMAILVHSEQSGKVCLCFWPITLSASPNMMHFVRTIMEKFCSSKTLLKMAGGGGMHPSHPPLDPPLTTVLNIDSLSDIFLVVK